MHCQHVHLHAFLVGEDALTDLAFLSGIPLSWVRVAVFRMDRLMVSHLADLPETFATDVTCVRFVVTVDLLVEPKFVERISPVTIAFVARQQVHIDFVFLPHVVSRALPAQEFLRALWTPKFITVRDMTLDMFLECLFLPKFGKTARFRALEDIFPHEFWL